MDSSYDSIPEEFVDPIMNEFAYDPIRLPITEDPAQVLYNRRTLEKIWDDKHYAVNPYTRQPFDIRNAIPQTELRQQMRQYIVENSTNCLEVISVDYTKPLNSTDMKHLLSELVIAGKHCLLASDNWNSKESEACWKVLWQKLNLLRLYCQYAAENRETFLSVKGYEFLLNVINRRLNSLIQRYPSIEDSEEACKEVAKIVDLVRLKDSDLQVAPRDNVYSFLEILSGLSKCELLKIQTIVLRIYRRMCEDCFDCILGRYPWMFSHVSFRAALHVLNHRRNSKDITNEDLYNGTAILKFNWAIRNGWGDQYYVDALVNVVIICISRFQDLHAAATHRAQSSFINTCHEDRNHEEEEKNIDLISRALDQGLFLIDSIVRDDEENRGYVHPMWREMLKHRVQMLDIVKDIVKMVELVVAGVKFFQSSHLVFGLIITAILCQEDKISVTTRKNVVKVFPDFLGSHIVDEYDTQVKLLLEDIVRNVS